MGVLYLFLPFPVVFAWFRYVFERAAYKESIQTIQELGGTPNIEWYVKQLSGPAYLWSWVFKKQMRKWFAGNC